MGPDSIFAQAIEIASAHERAAFLDQACGTDPGLRRELEQLIRDHFRAAAFLERPAAHSAATADEPVGEGLGPYGLMEEIGGGGMAWSSSPSRPSSSAARWRAGHPGPRVAIGIQGPGRV